MPSLGQHESFDMLRQVVVNMVDTQIKAICLCRDHNLITPALILCYTTMDQMAYLGMPPGQFDVNEKFFRQWCDAYMLTGEVVIPCSSADLWGARCGLVHAHSAESRRYREGKVNRIFYAWGDKTVDEARSLLSQLDLPELIIHIDDLISCTTEAISRFLAEAQRNDDKMWLVFTRAKKVITNYHDFPGTNTFPHDNASA